MPDSKMSLNEAQELFLSTMRKLGKSDHFALLKWIAEEWKIDGVN